MVTNKDCKEYLTLRGKGWVCEVENNIVGFAIVDMKEYGIWALFVQPGYDGKGIGKKLYNIMIDWYFNQTKQKAWLTTSPGTRAEMFYRDLGWREVGRMPNGEIKFELSFDEWKSIAVKALRH